MSNSSDVLTINPKLVELLREADSVTILTGAGVSAESGIPTFREAQTGLWAKYDPHQLASPQAFAENPQLVMDWYRWRRNLVERTLPNPAHYALAKLEQKIRKFTLITQNIDGLHSKAGSINFVELHGTLHQLCCSDSNCHYTFAAWSKEELLQCPVCGSLLRPNVVWFGEALSPNVLETAVHSSQHCEFFFSIGTSGVVEPAASLPYEALRAGAWLVEINPQPTPLTIHAHYYFPHPAGQILPLLVNTVWPS